MFKVNIEVDSLEKLDDYIKYVESMNNMKADAEFQKFIQNKCLEAVRNISDQRINHATTDDEYVAEYKLRHKIRETSDGFILYNDTILPSYMLSADPNDYPDGFSIALAFEYGIGIVGENSPKKGAWEYNMKKHNFAWYYTKYGQKYSTYGYEGFEIYRYTAEEITKKLKDWIMEYRKSKGGVSALWY